MTKNKNNKTKTNPLHRRISRPQGPKVTFDGTRLNAHWYAGTSTSLVNVASALIAVDAAVTNVNVAPQLTFSAAFPTSAITNAYQEYRYNSLHIKWLPMISPGLAGGGSRITAAYFDNPEIISTMMATTSAGLIPFVKGCRNSESWNAWENHTYRVPLTRRKPWFDVNTTISYTIDITERSVQGIVVLVVESINATENLGQINPVYDLTVRGLSVGTST